MLSFEAKLILWSSAAILLFLGFVAWFAWFSAYQESATYNRLTGAHTTYWDAMWVELRVQDAPKK